jgi:hypothetical protein
MQKGHAIISPPESAGQKTSESVFYFELASQTFIIMQKAPTFFLTATGASRLVGGPPGPTAPLLLLFHGHAGAQTAHDLNATLRGLYPTVEELQIASIVDLHSVPRFMRPVVTPTLSAAYSKSAASVPQGYDPREYVIIAPDWEGMVTRAFGMTERTHDVGLVLIAPGWKFYDRYIGDDPQGAATRMVDGCLRASSDTAAGSPTAP